jgi:hypothetical protein
MCLRCWSWWVSMLQFSRSRCEYGFGSLFLFTLLYFACICSRCSFNLALLASKFTVSSRSLAELSSICFPVKITVKMTRWTAICLVTYVFFEVTDWILLLLQLDLDNFQKQLTNFPFRLSNCFGKLVKHSSVSRLAARRAFRGANLSRKRFWVNLEISDGNKEIFFLPFKFSASPEQNLTAIPE